MFVGIDFGTSNSSVSVYSSGELSFFDLDPYHHNPHVLPSFIHINDEQNILVGVEAVNAYLEQETGRKPVWEKRYLGEMQITVSGGKNPIVYMQDILVDIDTAAKGRLLQSIKTGLQNPGYKGTQIFDRYYTIEELIAILLKALRVKCETQLQQDIDQVVLGRPVKFSHKPEVDTLAQEKLFRAAQLAGFKDVVFEFEPVGGAYLYHQTRTERENVLVFDFGGGTLDMTIMEVGGVQSPVTIASHGVILGGDDLTANLMQKLLRFFGQEALLPDGLPVPAYIFEMLFNWKNIVELSKPEHANIINEAVRGSDPIAAKRLKKLVEEKHGFRLFQLLDSIKINLSTDYYARFDFFEADLKIKDHFLRTHFEALIQAEINMINQEIEALMNRSGLSDDQIHAVLRTGGSSEIPVVIEQLTNRFGYDRIKEINPFTTIVGGLALKAHELSSQ